MPLPIFRVHAQPGASPITTPNPDYIIQEGPAIRPYGTLTTTPPPTTTINAPARSNRINLSKWTEIQSKISTIRAARSFPPVSFSEITTTDEIKAEHYIELLVNGEMSENSGVSTFTNSELEGPTTFDEAFGINQNLNSNDGTLGVDPATGINLGPLPLPRKVFFEGALSPKFYNWPTVRDPEQLRNQFITATTLRSIITALNSSINSCTCNCNYCTCNCNYCTCNCNYSCTCNCNYSDMRLKTNITFSHMIDGLNFYKFSYIWDKSKMYLGVIAQELIGTKYQNALSKDDKNLYIVDYSKLPFKMKEV
jgi:hypothetical protein